MTPVLILICGTMIMVLSSRQSHCESSPGSFDECRTAPSGRRPKTKPDDLGCESACTGCQKLHPPLPFIIITQPESWYSFYRPTWGTIRYNSVYLMCSKKLTCSQLSLPHGSIEGWVDLGTASHAGSCIGFRDVYLWHDRTSHTAVRQVTSTSHTSLRRATSTSHRLPADHFNVVSHLIASTLST